jgi:tetratricopeptide (TPR) repeat protein
MSCPQAEVLATFIEGRLAGAERNETAAHVASCEDCYGIVRRSLREPEARPARRATESTPATRWLLPVAATVALALGGWQLFVAWEEPETPLDGLVAAVGERRLIEPRLSGGFRFGPLVAATRGGGEPNGSDLSLLAAAARAQAAAHAEPSAANRRALAAAQLLKGDVDAAIAGLAALVVEVPADVAARNDLAAAHLVRGQKLGDAASYRAALDAASAVLAADPKSSEALFNKALALEGLGDRAAAVAAWSAVIADTSQEPGWAAVAREHAADQGASSNP